MQSIVKVVNLSHRYSKEWAINGIDFEINSSGVLGLLGSNGAGKSTTMNIICGVLKQTVGDVFINGINLSENPIEAKKYLGFLPQNAPLYMELTVDEYLRHCGRMRLMTHKEIADALPEVKERCGISHFSKRLIQNLSGGYRQRVGIAQAILHGPQLVVLDEPTNGLDPNQITEVRSLIKDIGMDRVVIFSSHILSEIQATCQYLKMIEGGKMVFADTTEAFNNYIKPNSLVVSFRNTPAIEELLRIQGVKKASLLYANTIRVFFDSSTDVAEHIVKTSVEKEWRLTEITLEKSSLDEIFAQLSNKLKK